MDERIIFDKALDIDDLDARAAYLNEACGEDTDLRAAVEARLFGKHIENDEHPVLSDPDDESDDEPDPLHERVEHLLKLANRARGVHPTSADFRHLLDEVWHMHRAKSADYGEDTDPLANIRQSAAAVGVEPWRGCLLRMMDKVQRLRTYCAKGTGGILWNITFFFSQF